MVGGHITHHTLRPAAQRLGEILDQHVLNLWASKYRFIHIMHLVFHGVDITSRITANNKRQQSYIQGG